MATKNSGGFTASMCLIRKPHTLLQAAINHKHWKSNQLPNRERRNKIHGQQSQ